MKKPQQSEHFPDSFFRVTVKGLCVRDGKVLMIHDYSGRSDTDMSPEWELPGGGLDFDESFTDCLKREVKEEMALEVTSIDEKPTYIWSTKHGTGRGMEWYWVLTMFYRFELADLNFIPTEACKEIKFFSKEDLQTNLKDLASQVVPLAEHFDPKDFK